MKRPLVAGGIAMVGLLLIVAIGLAGRAESATAFVGRWLHSVTGDGLADRGWSQMDVGSRHSFGDDAEAFRLAASAEDWSQFRWTVEPAYQLESWLWSVYINVEGGLPATPAFLRDPRLVGPWCVDDSAPGIHVQVTQEWPWSQRTLGTGGFTGSAERALDAGACVQASVPPEQFLPGGEMVWIGHQLSVRNWTTLPLFLLDEGEHRVDLPPCQEVALDGYGREFAVRAANGYVMAIGLDLPQAGVTTFVVIGSHGEYVNNAPPVEPMPPCEGVPFVQVGF